MQPNQSIPLLLKRLWHHISLRRRGQFGLLLVLMLLASFSEIISIGAVLPFLGVLTAPERVFEHAAAQPIIHALDLTEPSQLLLPLTVIFGGAALIAGAMRLVLLWASTRISFTTGADLSISVYRRTLYQPYAVHCSRNSSEIINGITGKTSSVIFGVISPVLTLITSSVMLITILIALLMVEPTMAFLAFGGFGLIYLLIIRFSRKQLLVNSHRIADESTRVIKSLQEGLGGIRDVLIDGSQSIYSQIYRDADLPLRRAQGDNAFISASPRYAMEALGMLLITAMAYILALEVDGISKAIPVLGAFALGAQRLLPVLQMAYGAWAGLQGSRVSLQDTLELLEQPLPKYADQIDNEPIDFKYDVSLKQVSYSYVQNGPNVLNKIDVSIAKGSRVGFIGATGSGKSTLLDIIMGLLEPTEGVMCVDGKVITPENHRSWQAHIAHVPQTIFLSDSSVEENIAFGVPKEKIDPDRVRRAAEQAQIAETIESWSDKYQTFVGERGARLSGGQRQRIGIARALYKKADVVIFDEATSALDNETEEAVMESIKNLSKDLTLLIIAHRTSTLSSCDKIIELDDCTIKNIRSYQELANGKNNDEK